MDYVTVTFTALPGRTYHAVVDSAEGEVNNEANRHRRITIDSGLLDDPNAGRGSDFMAAVIAAFDGYYDQAVRVMRRPSDPAPSRTGVLYDLTYGLQALDPMFDVLGITPDGVYAAGPIQLDDLVRLVDETLAEDALRERIRTAVLHDVCRQRNGSRFDPSV